MACLVYQCRVKDDDDASIPLKFLENNEVYTIKATRKTSDGVRGRDLKSKLNEQNEMHL